MDAIYAWDQPDIDLYVPGGDHHPAIEAFRFQTSLSVGRGLRSIHKPEDAGGCVGGSVTALAEDVVEGEVVFA